jgi:PHD/YefM family antitoxin component YafN of YafNO toxin-antitoxin module
MTTFTVRAGDIRLPREAREALDHREPVTVTERDRPAFVILHPDEYAYAKPILERRRRGLPIPIERLLTDEDLAVMAMDESDDDFVGDGIQESWND